MVVWTTSPDVNVHPCGLQFGFLEPDLEGENANRIGEDFKWRQVESGWGIEQQLNCTVQFTFSLKARMMPLNVAATSVKLAMPPPMRRALLRPSGSAVTHYKDFNIIHDR